MTNVLMIISAADKLTMADGTSHATGYWAEEVAASHETLVQAGFTVEIATPGGATPTVDQLSLSTDGGVSPEEAARFRTYLDGIQGDLQAPKPLAAVEPSTFDAVYIPGGHAPMADLAASAEVGRILAAAEEAGKPVVALCHGVAALLSGRNGSGWLYEGRRMTGFTDEEEQQGGYGDQIPFSVEASLRDAGGVLETGAAWSDTVVVDGTLITGQNPQSSISTAKALISALAG